MNSESTTDPSFPLPSATGDPGQPKISYWRKMGAGSLFISLVIHGIIVAVGIVLIVGIIPPPKEKVVDFRTRGGGEGGSPAASKSLQKNQANLVKSLPSRVAARNVSGGFSLPEPDSAAGLSALGALSGAGGGGMGAGAGKVGSGDGTGSGTGSGKGVGMSGGSGLMVFGTALEARSIGVVMDVSGSMTRHLERVLKELDRVANGSPVVLHVGCGISGSKTREAIEPVDSPMRSNAKERFKRFWYLYQDPFYRDEKKDSRTKIDFSRPLPLPEVYEKFAGRPNTYYNDPDGPRSTADALLAKQFENVDAIYWFADFQDRIDPEEVDRVLKTLRRRKQKLFIHASIQGAYIDSARDQLALPSGGKEIVPTTDAAKK